MTEKEKMLAGAAYHAGDAELTADRGRASVWMVRYNAMLGSSSGERRGVLREIMSGVGDGAVVRPPFHCDYGFNIVLGRDVFLNFGCVILDVMTVSIGEGTQIGPGVQIYAADHLRDPAVRATGAELGRAVVVGRNVWIGGGAILLPGVVVGDDAIVGAGAVVTRDVPRGATVVGNPARVAGARGVDGDRCDGDRAHARPGGEVRGDHGGVGGIGCTGV